MGAKSLKAARILAPEDIQIEQWVAVFTVTCEFLPCWAIESPSDIDRIRPVRFAYAPEAAGEPLRVIDVCLPFVLVECVSGAPRVLDLRACTLVAIALRFAKAVRRRRREKGNRAANVERCYSS